MTHEQTKLLRINLLRQLKATSPQPLPVSRLHGGAKLEGFDEPETAIACECEFLCDLEPPMAGRVKEAFSSAVRRYKITPAGREWLEMEGF